MRRLGGLLAWMGVAVWGAGILAWLFGVWTTLPPDTVRVIVLALAALTGGLMLVAGATVSRAAKTRNNRDARLHSAQSPRELLSPELIGSTVARSHLRDHTSQVEDRVT
jgi:hypothetical protein